MTVVVQRLALDWRAARWGRWRPSALARNSGPAAIRLEQLVVRDGVGLEEALEAVARQVEGDVNREALTQLAARFPLRVRRRYVGEELLERAAADSPDAERLLVRADEETRFERIKARLAEIIGALPADERLLLQLRFEQGLKVADIARLQQADQKRLYRTLQRHSGGCGRRSRPKASTRRLCGRCWQRLSRMRGTVKPRCRAVYMKGIHHEP